VEIWSRFMKAAHQNVRPTALPGIAAPGWWPFPLPPPPVSSNAQPAPQAPVRDERLPPQSGIDGWLLDRLFGRR